MSSNNEHKERIEAGEQYARALERLRKAAPDFEQAMAIDSLRVAVLVYREGDDPRKILGPCIRVLQAWGNRVELEPR